MSRRRQRDSDGAAVSKRDSLYLNTKIKSALAWN